jgi:hypothetical protein
MNCGIKYIRGIISIWHQQREDISGGAFRFDTLALFKQADENSSMHSVYIPAVLVQIIQYNEK